MKQSHKPTIHTYQSMTEFMDYLATVPHVSLSEQSHDDLYHFRGTHTFEEALALVEGWSDGVNRIERFSKPIVDSISTHIERLDVRLDIEGQSIDIAEFVTGAPECWQHFESTVAESRGSRLLTLCVNNATSAGINKEQMIERGTFVCSTIQCLELAGFCVEVWLCFGINTNQSTTEDVRIRLKSSDQPLDMARLAFTVAHPSMLRRLFFAWLERLPIWAGKETHSYGYPVPSLLEQSSDISFPEHFAGETFPVSRLLDILRKQGVVLTTGESEAL